MDAIEILHRLKEMAADLKRAPTRNEFAKVVSRHHIETHYRNFSVLLQAAGLTPYREHLKVTNEIFERDVEKHIEEYQPRSVIERLPYPNIASWSDVHRPFVNMKVQERFLEYIGDAKPDYAFENGDGDDMFSHGKFARSHNVFTPREERALSRKQSEEFWAEAIRRSPKTKFVKLLGNHDIRPMKRILEVYPSAEDWITEALKRDFSYPGVETIFDHREEYVLGDIAVFHGYRSQLGAHRDYTLMNCIIGHTHRGGVVFRKIRGQVLWELNSGLAGDPEAKGLTYTSQKMTEWTPGFGAVDKLGPRFIPV